MQNIIPALLTLHIFGVTLWMGGAVVQYLFLTYSPAGGDTGKLQLRMQLTRRVYSMMIWHGMALIVISGVTIVFLFGLEWLRPRGFIHFKITLAALIILITYLGWRKFNIIRRLSETENPDAGQQQHLSETLHQWKIYIILELTGLACVVILGVFKFGF